MLSKQWQWIPHIDMIVLARSVQASTLICKPILALSTRLKALSSTDIEALGSKAVGAIMRAREAVLYHRLTAFRKHREENNDEDLYFPEPPTSGERALDPRCRRSQCRRTTVTIWHGVLKDPEGRSEVTAVDALKTELKRTRDSLCKLCKAVSSSHESLAEWVGSEEDETVAKTELSKILGENSLEWVQD